jgi:mannose-1-phosphate guanylyltransferase / mannose-6-phosphate isomerase
MTSAVKKGLVFPAILSGGSGTRLWPLSRRESPKQFLPLVGPASLLQDTVNRMSGAAFAAPVVICNHEHRFLIAEQLRETGINASAIVLEPTGRNTAAAATIAALVAMQSDPDAIVLLAPSDHVIGDRQAFERSVSTAIPAARAGSIVTFGVTPRIAETGYGYVERGGPLASASGAFNVARFTEKPDRATAESFLAAGNYFWNSGMFLFAAATLLREMEQFQPAVLEACKRAIVKGVRDADFLRLDEKEFLASPSIALDYAIMEHTKHAAIVPADMGWSDVGSWSSLWDISEKNADGNVLRGDALAVNTVGSYLHSDGPVIATIGVEDIVVVASNDAVLVVRRDSTQNVKQIVEILERRSRDAHARGGSEENQGKQ